MSKRTPRTEPTQRQVRQAGDPALRTLPKGYVRIRSEIGRLVEVPAEDLKDILSQYPMVRVVAGSEQSATYKQIKTLLDTYSPEQLRTALERLDEDVPDWVSPDFMASKLLEQGGPSLLESMFPEGGDLSGDTGAGLEEELEEV